jgi:type IV pilus assembly protein PilA
MIQTTASEWGGHSGFTLIELLIVIVVIGILAAIAIPRFDSARERAHFSAIVTDVRNLGSLQERFYQANMTYTGDLAELGYVGTQGVDVQVTEATAQGWAAVGTHRSLVVDQGCAFYLGNAAPPTLPNGQGHAAGTGVIECTR